MLIRSCKMQTVMKPNLYASLDMIPEIGTNGSIQCKYLLKTISKMQLRVQLLCIFQYKRMKNAIKVI